MGAQKVKSALAVVYCVHDDCHFLKESICSFKGAGPVYVFVSKEPWHGESGDWQRAEAVAKGAGASVVTGVWKDEASHRKAAHDLARKKGHTHVLIPDGDEIVEAALLDFLKDIAEHDLADVVHVEWDTYWHSPEYVVRPREPFRPVLLVSIENARNVHLRHFEGSRTLLLNDGYGIVHHLSYCGPESRIKRKVESWSHHSEVVPGWWQNVWLQWQFDHCLRNLHPTHPANYQFVERIPIPEPLLAVAETGVQAAVHIATQKRKTKSTWPNVSVVVPLYGGEQDIRLCLESLEKCRDLVSEVIVVDNASQDKAADVVKSYKWTCLIKNKTNLGFAKASNQGYEASTGEIVLFLNSDTVVPREGLKALIEDLTESGTVAAAGPVSNQIGHFQKIEPTYTSLESMPLFAEDLARSGRRPRETDMLVGFCLAVKRSVLDEVGAFDESFGVGLFEDNDLCHRMRREGYRLIVSERSFVHHKGSASFGRAKFDAHRLLMENRAKYVNKWKTDLELGFVAQLPGLTGQRIDYDENRKPETVFEAIKSDVRRADISLCMIVKDEERVLGDCLRSAGPFFKEMIVVDTGSTDRTVEIAREFGAEVYVHPWEDSFAVARNHSLSYANGKWIFWMDADDTLPFTTGHAIVQAALSSPANLHGYVVPVQFVDDGPGMGTRVDHVKLFRNLPGLHFEGRIHEQILASLRTKGGDVGRIQEVVMHSGYDTSESGQAKKRERDWKLLNLDIAERPDHPFVLFNLGMTAHYTDRQQEAVEWLSKSIEMAGEGESHARKAYALLACAHRALGNDAVAMQTLEKGLASVGPDPELHFLSGQTLTALGRLEAAVDHYDRALQCDPSGHFSSLDPGILGHKTWHNSAGVLAELGRYSEAKERYLKALELAPRFLVSAFLLFDIAMDKGDHVATGQVLDHVRAIEGISKNWCEMARRRNDNTGGQESSAFLFESVVRQEPASVDARIALSRVYFDLGKVTSALELLAPLEKHGIAEAAFLSGVCCVTLGETERAREHTVLAMQLNPGHVQTIAQLQRLNAMTGRPEDKDVVQ